MIMSAVIMYYDREEGRDSIILDDSIIEVYKYNGPERPVKIKGRLCCYSEGVITIDCSQGYESKIVKVPQDEVLNISVCEESKIKNIYI